MRRWSILVAGVSQIAVGLSQVAAFPAIDCFPVGPYGLSQQDSSVVSGALSLDGWSRICLQVRDPGWDATDCEYVYPTDVFRLADCREDTLRLAGCAGDFDGDGQRDVALLVKRIGDGSVRAFVRLAKGDGLHTVQLPPIMDEYGFESDPTIPPGPFCIRKPVSGTVHFQSEYGDYTYSPKGDLLVLGWETYAWGDTGFVVVHTAD